MNPEAFDFGHRRTPVGYAQKEATNLVDNLQLGTGQ
jgi:hypothetical protein